MRALLMLLSLTLLGVTPPRPGPVVVDYAGSLVTPMEGPVAAALKRDLGYDFQGEAKGSKALAILIRDGVRMPDVFISADASLVTMLADKGLIASSTTFGSAQLGLGYTKASRFAATFDSVRTGRGDLTSALATPGLRIARTDPALDPKGERTVRATAMFAGQKAAAQILGAADNPAQVFPEEDLLVRLETGSADVGFVYSTEAKARNLSFIPLPGKASLSDEITYTVAILKHAPHPAAAGAFAAYVLRGNGRRILQDAGITYFPQLK